MSLTDFNKESISNFRGWWSLPDPTDVDAEFALNAQNVRYLPGKVGSREGHSPVFSGGKALGMHSWLTSAFNVLLFHDGDKVRAKFFSPQELLVDMFNQAGAGFSIAEAGLRSLAAVFNSSGLGAGQCRIIDATMFPEFAAHKAFPPPMTIVPTLSEESPGQVSPGLHWVGYIMKSRSGFIGKPSPGDTFSPISITAAGGKKIKVTINGTMPTDAYSLQAIMTTVGNPNRFFFIPGSEWAVPPGLPFIATLYIDYSDAQLLMNKADLDATEQFYLMTQATNGTGPFNPSVVLTYGKRAVYIADDVVWVSDPGAYQCLTSDQHFVILPGRLRTLTGFVIRGVLYLLGPHWTYAVEDNGDRPATWHPPTEVDGQIGALGPNAVAANVTGGYSWVADDAGLYLFAGGAYSELPVSYFNSQEWRRINRAARHTVQVLDDHVNRRVQVLVPLDQATTPSHIFTWDYSEGRVAGQVKFSLDSIKDYPIGSFALVHDPQTNELVRWVGPGTAGGKVLRLDPSTHNDDIASIASIYESALMPPEGGRAPLNTVHGYHLRTRGSGSLGLRAYSLDRDQVVDRDPISLEASPGKDSLVLLDLVSEQVSLEVSMDEVGGWWEIARLDTYWSPYASTR